VEINEPDPESAKRVPQRYEMGWFNQIACFFIRPPIRDPLHRADRVRVARYVNQEAEIDDSLGVPALVPNNRLGVCIRPRLSSRGSVDPELKVGQDLRLRQQLVMTPQLQHAIKILQLSLPELEAVVQTELVSNPLQEEVTVKARKVEDAMATKPKPKFERNKPPKTFAS
jgi:hypothetical protein